MIPSVFNELIRGVNRQALIKELDQRGYLAHYKTGSLMDTRSVHGESKRGVVFIPSAWEGEPDPAEVEEELQKAKRGTIEDLFED